LSPPQVWLTEPLRLLDAAIDSGEAAAATVKFLQSTIDFIAKALRDVRVRLGWIQRLVACHEISVVVLVNRSCSRREASCQ